MTTTSWQDTLSQSTKKAEQGAKFKKQAGILLWDGAKEAIGDYLDSADSDPTAEEFASDVLAALGDRRKGDASKIKTVALAVVKKGLVLDNFENLSKAYAEATRLTKTARVQAAQDKAADEAVQAIEAPKSASKPESAALIVMAEGVDEAARILLVALGTDKHDAHKAFIRAITQEAAGLIPKPEPKPKKAAAPKGAAKKAAAKKAAPAAAKKAAPKGAAKKAAAPAPVQPDVEDPDVDDMFADLDDDLDADTEVETVEAPAPAKKVAAKPVRRGPVRR